ncbi:iron-containing alcohol dehydrogenase [Pseudorhodobacter sp. MZDSW-24AT]|uniref:iron-containing alcohol dehydrogenase n=1 Tax=Pseudorhodobacter sp. MZDSW-24AT TaxID=2052957 RepID=UPI000C1E63E8|nr:iron-containing alcohol dehydrogenase [Pseudorhodobacter sp. MZDSW-24AT]PJF08708.1 alcohol dehydrogenase [Pseudorhodobacter sp. MZDSW-24AT]
MTFSILQPGRVVFGRGQAAQAAEVARRFGPRGLLVHGANPARAASLIDALGPETRPLSCAAEPTLAMLEAAIAEGRAHRPDWVLAIGGGAALDLGKALAALIPAPGGAMDHLELVGRALPLCADPLPFIALPTTAGTGAEVTKNAVIGLPDRGRKVSLRDDRMIARVAIIDPALTDGCPWPVTLASGLDAVTQVIEPYVSCKATPYTDAISLPAIAPGLRALMRLHKSEDAAARDTLAYTSLSGGLALANAGLGVVHGFAGVIGGTTGAAHGAICGALLGPVLAMNRARSTGAARARLDQVCALLADVLGSTADAAPEALALWAHGAGLPRLSALGVTAPDHAALATAAETASSTKGNPVVLGHADLCQILERAG